MYGHPNLNTTKLLYKRTVGRYANLMWVNIYFKLFNNLNQLMLSNYEFKKNNNKILKSVGMELYLKVF